MRSTEGICASRPATLAAWSAVVAEGRGYDWPECLSLAGAVARQRYRGDAAPPGPVPASRRTTAAQAVARKGRFELQARHYVSLVHQRVVATTTAGGVRALASPWSLVRPEDVESFLQWSFGDRLDDVLRTMRTLARRYAPEELERQAVDLYVSMRPRLRPQQIDELSAGPLRLPAG